VITQSRLEALLTALQEQSPEEWKWKPRDAPGRESSSPYWCALKYLASRPPHTFFLEYNDEMLFVQYLFSELRVASESCWLALYRTLLRLNEELVLVKFGLTPDGQISFLGEIPAAQFSLDTLENLLRLMIFYLERLYWEIDVVATCPQLAEQLILREMKLARTDQKMRELVKTVKVERVAGPSSPRA
jgi:hypothetical protein